MGEDLSTPQWPTCSFCGMPLGSNACPECLSSPLCDAWRASSAEINALHAQLDQEKARSVVNAMNRAAADRHLELCTQLHQAALDAGLPVGINACGNGGVPTFGAVVAACVTAVAEIPTARQERDDARRGVAEQCARAERFRQMHAETARAHADAVWKLDGLVDVLRAARVYICQHTTPTAAEAAHGGIVDRIDAELAGLLGAPGAAQESDRRDARRWRALTGSARLRALGCAGLSGSDPDGYAHIGIEAWTQHPGDCQRGNAIAVEWLTQYADIASARQSSPPPG